MKKKYIVITPILVLIIVIGLLCNVFINNSNMNYNKLINISNLSDNFIEKYYQDIHDIKTDKEKENTLIAISLKKIKNTYNAKKIIEAPNNQYLLVYENEKDKKYAYKKFQHNNSIINISENIEYKTTTEPNEVEFNSWGIQAMGLDHAINETNKHNFGTITAAIIDTGCNIDLFNDNYNGKITDYYNLLEDSTTHINDEVGHGTHIAGTIAEGTPNNVKIFPVKVSRTKKMYTSDIIAGINYVVYYNKANVINMSFGTTTDLVAMEVAIAAANRKNITCIAAAGNENVSTKSYPAAYNNTISVASINSELNKSSFSNYGDTITFTAPGSNIKSINGYKDGTSMATPHVVSAAAILKSYNKNLKLNEVINLLKEKTIDLGDNGKDNIYGYGLISFENTEFCDQISCDEYNVYKKEKKEISNFEMNDLIFTNYNYYSVTNLLASLVKINYTDDTSEIISLGDIEDAEILNYDPTDTSEQTITIKISNKTITENIINPNNYESGWEYSNITQDTIELNGYKNHNLDIKKLYVPETINSKKVVAFANDVRYMETATDFINYEYLNLPLYFNKIGDYSLLETKFKHIEGNSTGIDIGTRALQSSYIEKIDIPIKNVRDYGFSNCVNLLYVNISGEYEETTPEGEKIGVATIGTNAFYNNKKLINVNKIINDKVRIKKVSTSAFYDCQSLEKFDLIVGEKIDQNAFNKCHMLTSIDLSNIKIIAQNAFEESGIHQAYFGNNIESIKDSAFMNCNNLTSVSIPSGTIENNAFKYANIEDISIGNITYIAPSAFAYNPIKTSNDRLTSTGNYNIIENVGIIQDNNLIVGFANKSEIENTTIPNTITEISDYAYSGNNNLKNIVIPESTTTIGSYSFNGCNQLEKVFLLNKDISFENDSFTKTIDDPELQTKTTFYIHQDANQTRISLLTLEYEYRYIEPTSIEITNNRTNYNALETFNDQNIQVKLTYYEEGIREETINPFNNEINAPLSQGVGYYATYQNGSSIQYGDEYYILHIRNEIGYETTRNINITVNQLETDYGVLPTNLVGYIGNSLSTVILPNNFEWKNNSETLNSLGEQTYKARYVPNDSINYKTIDNIDITIYVIENNPELDYFTNNTNDFDIYYDGNEHSIEINLEPSDYQIKYSIGNRNYDQDDLPTIIEAGEHTIYYKATAPGYNAIEGSNKLKIYGIKSKENSLTIKNQKLITNKRLIQELNNDIITYPSEKIIKYYDKTNIELTRENIKTGDNIITTLNNRNIEYRISLLGDTSGDGLINYLDYVNIYNHIQKIKHPESNKKILEDEYYYAGDMNNDEKISYLDYVKLYHNIKETKGGTS